MAEYTGPNPLNQAHCDGLTRACKITAQNAQLIQACKDCGLPMDQEEQANAAVLETAKSLKRTFFPGAN